jgi:hypothetical protein
MDNHHGRNLKVEERAWESLNTVPGECAVRVTFSRVTMAQIALVGCDRVLMRANLELSKQIISLDENMGQIELTRSPSICLNSVDTTFMKYWNM